MTPGGPIVFNPELLETFRIIRSTPTWKEVKASMTRLEPLRKPGAKPYDQMEVDRDNLLRYAAILKNSADAIRYGICLAAHLARFSTAQTNDQRLNEGFQALSTGLDLAAREETETKAELERCMKAAFPELPILTLPLAAPAPHPEAVPAAEVAHAEQNVPPAQNLPPANPTANITPSPVPPIEVEPRLAHAENASVDEANVNRPPIETPTVDQVPAENPAPENLPAANAEATPAAESPPGALPQQGSEQVAQKGDSTATTPPASSVPADAPATGPTSALPAPAPAVAPPDPWRDALTSALAAIGKMEPLNLDEVVKRATVSWQARLQAFTLGRPEVPPDIDYLRCRTRNLPMGTMLRARLKTVTMREWNETFAEATAETGSTTPVWVGLAALAALGFDVPLDVRLKEGPELDETSEFLSKLSRVSAKKGLLILRVTAESQTAAWNISPSMPALILTPEQFLRPWKTNLMTYFQERLHGILIEVGRDELPTAAQTRARLAEVKSRLPQTRIGLLTAVTPHGATPSDLPFTVLPADAGVAFQVFATKTT